MVTCFVIQPFDAAKFDKRFDDVFRPAIEDAGLEAYRVDRDPGVEVPIDSIEEGIRDAAICLADITTDNPNVWYELGYAFATARPVLMVCSDERMERRYPFDIQHRMVIHYQSESPRDFDRLRTNIKERIRALLTKGETLRQIAENDQVAAREGLSQPELLVLAAIAGDTVLPESARSLYHIKNDVERSGFTSLAFGLGFRRLLRKGLVEDVIQQDEDGLTSAGWDWVEENETLFILKKRRLEERGL